MNVESDKMLADIQNTQKMCQALMQSKHYQKIGSEGVFAIVEKAKSIGISPVDALNGGLYYVQGKVEMTASMMNQLIRQAGHSVTKDKKSDDTICILHGKRADNGDTWVESFSMDEAKKAKLTICKTRDGRVYDGPWQKFPRDMLFARALSRLARQLFPDVIKGVYVQGEISDAPPLHTPVEVCDVGEEICVSPDVDKENCLSQDEVDDRQQEVITLEQYKILEEKVSFFPELRENMLNFVKNTYKRKSLRETPPLVYQAFINRIDEEIEKQQQAIGE